MAEIGQETRGLVARSRVSWAYAFAALAVAAIPVMWLWSFTIDDALISVRYARHLADGVGYRFNHVGPSTDGVTPLPWVFLLWPLAHGTAFAVLTRAKALGCLVWLGTAFAWGAALGRAPGPRVAKIAALLGLGVCVPLAAHATSGMETAIATSLATGAALLHRRPWAAAALAGLAASLRPELLPWALGLAVMFGLVAEPPARGRVAVCAIAAVFPFAACVAVRLALFGSPAPLALTAKPSDLGHGVLYSVVAALVSVGPVMAFAPLAAWRTGGPGRAIVVAAGLHLLAVTAVGGDWMPYARLVVPVVPSLLYASVLFWSQSRPWVALARTGLAVALGVRTVLLAAPAGLHTGPDREELARRVGPYVAHARRVACADVGWVSAATEADIVDLGGATDPDIAALGGGHTSKRIDGALLLAKDPDALLLYADALDLPLERWREASFPHVVDARLARDELVVAHFAEVAFVPLGATGTGYYVLLRR